MAETARSTKPTCKAPSDEAKKPSAAEERSESVPAYYHPVAVRIYDQFIDEEPDIEFEVDASRLDHTVKLLCTIKYSIKLL